MISLVSSAGLKFVPTLLPEGYAILYDLLKETLRIGRQKCGYKGRCQGDVSPSKKICESLVGDFTWIPQRVSTLYLLLGVVASRRVRRISYPLRCPVGITTLSSASVRVHSNVFCCCCFLPLSLMKSGLLQLGTPGEGIL